MKIGLLAYSTNTGLGHQTQEFFKHMQPHKTLVVDLERFNLMPTFHEKFPGARVTRGIPSDTDLLWLLEDIDAVFVCETPLNYNLYTFAKERGVATIQQYNYEFLDYYKRPHLPKPTILAAPTEWNIDKVRAMGIAPVFSWPVPVNRGEVPFREIKECTTFVHVVGRPAVHDRNGTIPFLRAAQRIGQNFKYKLFVQPPNDPTAIKYFQPVLDVINEVKDEINLEVIENAPNYSDIYKAGDVLVLPRKYGGLCLPMQEALSAGMPVIMTDISPNRTLPSSWLVKADFREIFHAHVDVEVYEPVPYHLEFTMEQFADPAIMDISNQLANQLAEKLSWSRLKPYYETLIAQTVDLLRTHI